MGRNLAMDGEGVFSLSPLLCQNKQPDVQQRIHDGSRYMDASNAILHGINCIDDDPMAQWAQNEVYRLACKNEDEMGWMNSEPSGEQFCH
jgi:hypothetical protein